MQRCAYYIRRRSYLPLCISDMILYTYTQDKPETDTACKCGPENNANESKLDLCCES